MSGIKDQNRIEELRKRLYKRGTPITQHENHKLIDTKEKVTTTWQSPPKPNPVMQTVVQEITQSDEQIIETPTMATKKQKRGYRTKAILGGILFFVLAAVISSGFLLLGNNSISAENIDISVTGPFTVGGGEVLPLQVGITNGNAVSIEAATLIVEYPRGTLSAKDTVTELRTEHLSLDVIASGETINVPLRAIVFGEENDEQNVKVSIEYRVQGSNATFFKVAEPMRFKISSSPITIKAVALQKVSSGQHTTIELTVTSNAPVALSDIMVQADYPIGFDFVSAVPEILNAQNIWILKNLKPKETRVISITGIIVGKETDEYAINFSAGVPSEQDQQTLTSVFATAQTAFQIEFPFLDVKLNTEGDVSSPVMVTPGQRTNTYIDITNTLEDTIYDLSVDVQLGGNAISDVGVDTSNGFYDSLHNKIVWEVANTPQLAELQPGKNVRLSFTVTPSSDVLSTPNITLDVSAHARRVSETQVEERLVGTAKSEMKVASIPKLRADVGFNNGVFNDIGAIPPIAEKVTTYTASLMIENGSNNISDVVTTATLPVYVVWLGQTSGTGDITYNTTQRTISWKIPSIDANESSFGSFQVSLSPSKAQVGTAPTLVGQQRMKAVDLFTGTTVRSMNAAITSEMSTETGHPRDNGRVVE